MTSEEANKNNHPNGRPIGRSPISNRNIWCAIFKNSKLHEALRSESSVPFVVICGPNDEQVFLGLSNADQISAHDKIRQSLTKALRTSVSKKDSSNINFIYFLLDVTYVESPGSYVTSDDLLNWAKSGNDVTVLVWGSRNCLVQPKANEDGRSYTVTVPQKFLPHGTHGSITFTATSPSSSQALSTDTKSNVCITTISALPTEILDLIAQHLPQRDLISFSEVCRFTYQVAGRLLWQYVTLEWEKGLPNSPTFLRFTKSLRFEHNFRRSTPPLGQLINQNNLNELITYLQEDKLQEFQYGLFLCHPATILGRNGSLFSKQRQIRSLSISANEEYLGRECYFELHLSTLQNLRQLKSEVSFQFHATIFEAIRKNAQHLETLEFDYCSRIENKISEDYFVDAILGSRAPLAEPLLPKVATISLSNFPVTARLTEVIRLSNITSLMLQFCPGWSNFLQHIIRLEEVMPLKTFVLKYDKHSEDQSDNSLIDFLGSFTGLLSLAIYHPTPISPLSLWEHISQHHPNLINFIHDRGSSYNLIQRESYQDIPQLSESYWNPLSRLNLRFISLNCVSRSLKQLLLPYVSKDSLKVLHLRSADVSVTQRHWSIETDDDTRHFIEWVFGPDGITSLSVVAVGDFHHSFETGGVDSILFRRSADPERLYECSSRGDTRWATFVTEYHDLLRFF